MVSFDPSNAMSAGSGTGASLAVSIEIPVTQVAPTEGVTIKPAVLTFPFMSKLRYFAWVPSMAFATASVAGLLADEAIIGSFGWTTFFCAYCPYATPVSSAGKAMAKPSHFPDVFLGEVFLIGSGEV